MPSAFNHCVGEVIALTPLAAAWGVSFVCALIGLELLSGRNYGAPAERIAAAGLTIGAGVWAQPPLANAWPPSVSFPLHAIVVSLCVVVLATASGLNTRAEVSRCARADGRRLAAGSGHRAQPWGADLRPARPGGRRLRRRADRHGDDHRQPALGDAAAGPASLVWPGEPRVPGALPGDGHRRLPSHRTRRHQAHAAGSEPATPCPTSRRPRWPRSRGRCCSP